MTLGLGSFAAQAADIEAGKSKSAVCSSCHGADGISTAPIYPNLKGQKAMYLELSLKAYKNDTRPNPIMKPMASMLSDEDIANVAAYYESLGQ